MAHSSWFTYAGMTRIYKHHDFALRHPAVRMQKASFSSYGGGRVPLLLTQTLPTTLTLDTPELSLVSNSPGPTTADPAIVSTASEMQPFSSRSCRACFHWLNNPFAGKLLRYWLVIGFCMRSP